MASAIASLEVSLVSMMRTVVTTIEQCDRNENERHLDLLRLIEKRNGT